MTTISDLPRLLRELDTRLADDPSEVLEGLALALDQPPASLHELQRALAALAALAGRWGARARGMIAEADAEIGREDALFHVEPEIDLERLADPVQALVEAAAVRSDALCAQGHLQHAMDTLLLGGAVAGHSGPFDDAPLIAALGRLEIQFGGPAVDEALDHSWLASPATPA